MVRDTEVIKRKTLFVIINERTTLKVYGHQN